MRSPMARHRPWISDQFWIAHESLPAFDRIAALFGRNGWWRLGEGGATLIEGKTAPDLSEFMSKAMADSVPAVVHAPDYEFQDSTEAAMQSLMTDGVQLVEALTPEGGVHWFVHDVIVVLSYAKGSQWEWRIATGATGAMLLAVDRKGRPRLLLNEWMRSGGES